MEVILVPAPGAARTQQPAGSAGASAAGPAAAPASPASPNGAAAGRRAANRSPAGGPLPALWIAALAAAGLVLAARIARRQRRMRCEKCRARMQRLARVEAFDHLDAAERTEQLVGDVRHEVWRCPGCGGIAKRSLERALPESARRLVPPVGSAAELHRRSRQGPSLFGGALDDAESSTGAARGERTD